MCVRVKHAIYKLGFLREAKTLGLVAAERILVLLFCLLRIWCMRKECLSVFEGAEIGISIFSLNRI